MGEALGHAVGTVQIEAKRVVGDGKKLLHQVHAEARDRGRETVRQVKAHPWAASGIVVGAGALIGAAVAGYKRVRGPR